jgi:LPPG:FO 2-phospho-L-lactate transferase
MTGTPRIVVLAGGVGGSRFVLGVRGALRARGLDDTATALTVVVNTGDDLWLSGVRLQPDVDSITYALAGVNDAERGWGRQGDSERVNHELQEWGAGWPWFTLGDLDLGTHLARTGWLRDGLTPTQVLERMSHRWDLGARLLPMTDAEVDTVVVLEDGTRLHFQEWWTRHRASLTPLRFDNPGIETAAPAPGVLAAIAAADVVLIAPSNPVVSIGPILAVPGIRDALRETDAPVVAVSPLVDGAVLKGPTADFIAWTGQPATAGGVAELLGDVLDGMVCDERRAGPLPVLRTDTLMADAEGRRRVAGAALTFAEALGS